jgi:hypothetical protein
VHLFLLKNMRTEINSRSVWNLLKKIAITLILSFPFSCPFAQDTSRNVTPPAQLDTIKGVNQTIYYSAGRVERARSIVNFMHSAITYFQNEISFTPNTKLYILAPQDWKGIAAQPLKNVYGFPHNLDSGRLVIAADDNAFWASFLPPVEKFPPPLAAQISKAYGKPDGTYSMMPFFDLLALHELGHSYTSQAGLKMHRHWMAELFVNIMLHTYVAEKQPQLLPALEAFPDMVIAAGASGYPFTSLVDFERLYPTLGMGAKNYGWYQCRLHAAAKAIYNSGGSGIMKKLWTVLKKYQREMTDNEFTTMLSKEVHPSVANVYLKW